MNNTNKNSASFLVSVLVTREEYSNAYAYKRKKQAKAVPYLMLIIGVLLIILGFVSYFINRISEMFYFNIAASASLFVLGVASLVVSRFFLPIFHRAEAVNEFDNKPDLQFATIYEFKNIDKPTIRISNDSIEGELLVSLVTEWIETPEFILFSFSRELEGAIPKRLLNDNQKEAILNILKEDAKDAELV